MTEPYDPESLEAVIEYFDQRADAEYFTDRASPVGNEEMRHLVAAKSARDEIARLTAERDEAKEIADAAFPVVPDKVTKVTLAVLDVVASGQKVLSAGGAKSTAELIVKLCTERDQYRDAMETYSGSLIKATQAQVAAEAKLREARGLALDVLTGIKTHGELASVSAEVFPFSPTGGKKPQSKEVWQFPRHMLTDIDEAMTTIRALSNPEQYR